MRLTSCAKGAKAYMLDLRNNGGGLLYAAVQIASKFIPDGPIVSTIDRYGHVESENATQDAMPPHPLVVLVNQFSASASEITAGALQDTKIGTLIGTTGSTTLNNINNTVGTLGNYVAGNGFDGWIEQQRLWGVYADEKVE